MATLSVDQSIVDGMVDQAVQMAAALKFQGDQAQTLRALRMGRCDICETVSDCLVRQVGEYLGELDRTVKAVYQYRPESLPLHPHGEFPRPPSQRSGINLLTWVERKNPALTALGASLEKALAGSRKRFSCANATPACTILDIQMVETRDIQENRGYGMFANAVSVRSAQVWQREEAYPEAVSLPGDLQGRPAHLDLEFSPESALFDQAVAIERQPLAERPAEARRLVEIKMALIRRLISDQPAYITIATEWFTIDDLAEIYQRKIGSGRIGGKAAGMVLASRILRESLDEPTRRRIQTPESFFLGSDLIYIFMAMNGLMHWNNQKYKPADQIRSEYPQLRSEFLRGGFPPEIVSDLAVMLAQIGPRPIIVRSSSLLEDNFGTSFAGKYESVFLANQGTREQNLEALTGTISRIYASTLKPEALLYRRSKGLQDYDERMAVLIQAVQGEKFGRYYFPFAAGVAFSRNLYRWSPQIRKEDGFLRMVWGLGTRAVERLGNEYPRFVALSHPTLQPDDTPEAIRYYSQQNIDLIDLEENRLRSLPAHEVLSPDYPPLRFLAQRIDEDGYLGRLHGRVRRADLPRLAITYDDLLARTTFAETMGRMLKSLERHYGVPVDVEFTARVVDPDSARPQVLITLLQCRPQSFLAAGRKSPLPEDLSPAETVFTTGFLVPQGFVGDIRHILFVVPEVYFALQSQAARNRLRRLIALLNVALPEKSFVCVGPGRWGTTNPDLGVFVSYSDIDRTAALVELSGPGLGPAPEPSLGTHFFQDLMEANIYPLAVCLDQKGASLNRDFFYGSPNRIEAYTAVDPELKDCLRLIAVADAYPGAHLELVMDDEQNRAVAYRVKDRL